MLFFVYLHIQKDNSIKGEMAKFILSGIIDGIRYSESCVTVVVSEMRRGYVRKDGVRVDDGIFVWRVNFSSVQRSYISNHFHRGMLVDIYGIVVPYTKDRDGNMVDGISIIGKVMDVGTYQRNTIREEKKMLKESMDGMDGQPDLDGYNSEDF